MTWFPRLITRAEFEQKEIEKLSDSDRYEALEAIYLEKQLKTIEFIQKQTKNLNTIRAEVIGNEAVLAMIDKDLEQMQRFLNGFFRVKKVRSHER